MTSKSEDDTQLTDRETYTEISNLVFAGTDTTSTTLTYLFWELAKHQDWQTRLREELCQTIWDDVVPSDKHLTDLPILDAVITEALRLHPAAPASLQRETPSGGRTLNGVFVPEKVRGIEPQLRLQVFQVTNCHISDNCVSAVLYHTTRPQFFPSSRHF
ncbi:hypothetical protein ACHAQJ_002261 [Trichoderma viride]